jgi:hypothetical protein
MSNTHRLRSWVLAPGLVVALWVAAGAVQAREVVWSVGVGGPGAQFGVTNAAPVLVQPQPVYWHRPAVLVQPQPVYYYVAPQPVVYAQPQVIVAPQPIYRGWGPYHRGQWVHWDHRHRGFDEDRHHRGRGRD